MPPRREEEESEPESALSDDLEENNDERTLTVTASDGGDGLAVTDAANVAGGGGGGGRRSWVHRKKPARDPQFAAFAEDVKVMRKHIHKFSRGIIHPRTAHWLQYWDMLIALSVVFTAVVTPVDIFMRKEIPENVGTIFYVGMFLNFLFFIDVYINLNRAFRESRQAGGRWVTNRRRIVAHYAKRWLWIDIVAAIPFDLPVAFELIDLSEGGR